MSLEQFFAPQPMTPSPASWDAAATGGKRYIRVQYVQYSAVCMPAMSCILYYTDRPGNENSSEEKTTGTAFSPHTVTVLSGDQRQKIKQVKQEDNEARSPAGALPLSYPEQIINNPM